MTEPFAYLPSARRPHPGRPRKHPENGHVPGMSAVQGADTEGLAGRPLAWEAKGSVPPARTGERWRQPLPLPRLFVLEAAAAYLGVSPWTVRGLADAGTLPRVRIPLPSGKTLRKYLFDREDLDRLVRNWKGE